MASLLKMSEFCEYQRCIKPPIGKRIVKSEPRSLCKQHIVWYNIRVEDD